MSVQFFISNVLIGIGLFLWFWGTIPVSNKLHNFLYKLHTLTVSDTVGSVFIVFGLFVYSPHQWPILSVVTISFILWNTIFSYLLAVLSNK